MNEEIFRKLCKITGLDADVIFAVEPLIDTSSIAWMTHITGHPFYEMEDPGERIDYDSRVDRYAGSYKSGDGIVLKIGFTIQRGMLPITSFNVVAGEMLYIITYWHTTGNITIEESVFDNIVFGDSDGEELNKYLSGEYKIEKSVSLSEVQLDWPDLISLKE